MSENDFLLLAAARYSVRKFADKPVSRDHIAKILEAGRLAPTACNRQPQRVLVLDTPDDMEKVKRCTSSHFDAPAAMLVCYDKSDCWVRRFDSKSSGEIDASIVAAHMMLEAASIGVGSTWVMHFDPRAVREELEVPLTLEPTALLVMGYPAADAQPYPGHKESKSLEQLTFYHRFSK